MGEHEVFPLHRGCVQFGTHYSVSRLPVLGPRAQVNETGPRLLAKADRAIERVLFDAHMLPLDADAVVGEYFEA